MNSQSRSVRELLRGEGRGTEVSAQGWLRTVRHSKSVSFLALNDGSCLGDLQVVVAPERMGSGSALQGLATGAAVRVCGELALSPGKGQRFELQATSIEVVGGVDDDYPLQKKRHSFEYLRTIAHLRPRTNTHGAVLRVRSAASRAIHAFFYARGFLQLHSPIITSSDAEGAGDLFRVTTLPLHDPPRTVEGAVDETKDFFGRATYLTVSGQLEAEIGALALSKVYTFGPTFRAENSNTSRHLAEFWMVEPEVAFCDLKGLGELVESFLKEVLRAIREDCAEDLAFFDARIDDSVLSSLEFVIETPFERMTYSDAIERLKASGRAFEFPVEWGVDLQSEHERWLTEEHVKRPVVLTDYPKAIKAFYMYANDDDRTVAALDVLVPRIGEIVGGSQREHRFDVLKQRIARAGLPPEEYDWYLDLRRFGSVPHAGFGLGFERLVQYVTGMANIRDVIPFPRVPGSATF